MGAGNSADQTAVHLAAHARKVTILVRRTTLAETMSRYLIEAIDGAAQHQGALPDRDRRRIKRRRARKPLTPHDSGRGV